MTNLALMIALLYLVLGMHIFSVGIRQFGGKDEYMKYIVDHGSVNPEISYTLSAIIFTLIWPRYVIKSIRSIRKHEDEEDSNEKEN